MFTMLPVLEQFLYRSTIDGDEEVNNDSEEEEVCDNDQDEDEDEDQDEDEDEDEDQDEDQDEDYDCDDPNDEDYEPSEQEDEQAGDEQSSKEKDIPSIYQIAAINVLVNYHWITSKFQVWRMQVYENNSWIKMWTNTLYTFSKNVYDSAANLFTFCKTEPTSVEWICESSLVIDQCTVRLELIEKYYKDKYIQKFENMCSGMQDVVDHFSYLHYNVMENLILYKFAEDGYMLRTFIKGNKASIKNDLASEPSLANVRFLSIQYSHPSMKEPLFFNIPRGMYYCGNHILSAAHVFRLLQYQSADYVFDTQYTLHLMDQDVNESQLTSQQYICVEKDRFAVCTVQV